MSIIEFLVKILKPAAPANCNNAALATVGYSCTYVKFLPKEATKFVPVNQNKIIKWHQPWQTVGLCADYVNFLKLFEDIRRLQFTRV